MNDKLTIVYCLNYFSQIETHIPMNYHNLSIVKYYGITKDPETGEEIVTVYYHCDDEYVSRISYRMSDVEAYAEEEFPILASEPIDRRNNEGGRCHN